MLTLDHAQWRFTSSVIPVCTLCAAWLTIQVSTAKKHKVRLEMNKIILTLNATCIEKDTITSQFPVIVPRNRWLAP